MMKTPMDIEPGPSQAQGQKRTAADAGLDAAQASGAHLDDNADADLSARMEQVFKKHREDTDGATIHSTEVTAPCPVAATAAEAQLVPVGTHGLQVDPSHFSAIPFASDASDSESEAEDNYKTFTYTPPGAKQPRLPAQTTYNLTKRDARDKTGRTKRKDGKRTVARVDNRVHRPEDWPELENDSKAILAKYGEGQKGNFYKSTTVLCTVLVRKDKQTGTEEYRKILFTNSKGKPPKDLIAAAKDSGYHVVVAEQSHAESEMIEYMRVYGYDRVADMGCDKPHCPECNRVMEHNLGADYPTQSAKSSKVYANYKTSALWEKATGLPERPAKTEGWKIPS